MSAAAAASATDVPVKSDLFKDVKYYVNGTLEPEIQKLLDNGGASWAKIMFSNVTHLLCGADFDEKDATEALEIYDIPSVTGEWVKASIRLGRLACPKTYHPVPGGLFQSIVAAVAQLNVNDRKKLYALITFHGGRVERDFTPKTTHLVCGIATGNIYMKAMEMKSEKFCIITPDWFYECLKAQEIIDAKPYHPRLLKPAIAQNSSSSSTDTRSLSSILGLDDLKIDLKKNDSQRAKPSTADTISKASMDMQLSKSVSTAANTTVNSVSTKSSKTTIPLATTNADDVRTKADSIQTKPSDTVKSAPKVTTNQSIANQNKPLSDTTTNKERIDLQQTQTTGQQQISKTPSTPVPTPPQTPAPPTPVQTQFLQKQLEQPLKMDNQQQHHQQQITMQQQQPQQYQKPLQNHQQQPPPQQMQPNQMQHMMNQVKIDQSNQPSVMVQKSTMNSSTMQGPPNVQTHVQNINAQSIAIQSQNIGVPPQMGQTQNQIQIQPIQQQPNQMQQIGVDQIGGQMQFVNSAPQPGNATNFNAMPQQQMKVVQQQQINIQHQQQPPQQQQQQQQMQQQQQQQPTQQFIVQSPGPNKTILNQNVVFINQTGQQQIITSNQQQQGNNVALNQQQQRIMTSQQSMQIQGQQILIHSSVQQPNQNQLLQSPQQQQTQFIVQTGQSPNQRMQKVPGGVPGAQWFMQQQQQGQPQPHPQQQQQQQGMVVQSTDINQSISPHHIQNMQQKLIQQSPGSNQQIVYSNVQNVEHQEVMGQPQNQTIMITSNQPQTPQQQTPQTPPIQSAPGGMMQGQPQMQKMHVQNQIVLTSNQSPQHGGMQMQQQQQQQQQQQKPGPPVPGQPQFIRATRPQWPGNQPGLQRQLIQLDAQTHAHLQTLDPIQRAEYLSKLHKRNVLFRQQQQGFIQQGNVVAGQPRPPNHVMTRPQMPGAQQMQWIQQQQQQQQQQQSQQGPQQRPLLVRGAAPGLSPISVSPGGNLGPQQSPQQPQFADPNAPPQFQRIQIQQVPGQKPMQQPPPPPPNMVVSVQKPFAESADQQTVSGGPLPTPPPLQSNQVIQQSPTGDIHSSPLQMNKTKTALANMLSNRLSANNGAALQIPPPPSTDGAAQVVEPSAAGTLRMMTAQHNSSALPGQQQFTIDPNAQQQQQQQQQSVPPPPPQFQRIQLQASNAIGQKPIAQANMIVTAQKIYPDNINDQQHQQQQLGVPPNQLAGMMPQTPPADAILSPQIQMNKGKTPLLQSPSGMKSPPFSPGRPLPRPQFYGHNPNLKIPPNLFMLGCIFYIVEYDDTHPNELPEWKTLIQRHGGEIETVYCPRVTHVLCCTQRHGVVMQALRDLKRCVTAYWLSDTVIRKQVQPPTEALHLPMPSTFGTQRPATKHIISISGFEGDERKRIKEMVEESGAQLTLYFSRHNSVLICKKQEGNKFKRAKDWNIPVVNCAWLSDILQGDLSHMSQYDQPKYQQYNVNAPFRIDYSLVANLMTAWKSPINLTQESYERVKRQLAEPATTEPKPKRIRKHEPLEVLPEKIVCNEKPEQVPRILLSQVDNSNGLINAVKLLGGEVVTEPETATHIVLTQLMRSYKLLFALCVVDHIVSSKWIVDSAKAGKFLRPDEYALNSDDEFRKHFKCDIQEVIKSTTRKTLFAGKTFFVTPSVRPKPSEIIRLIEFCGGKVEPKRRKATEIYQTNAQQPDSYIILTCSKDLHLVHDLMHTGKPNRCICSTELVMTAIMQQKINVDPHIIAFDRSKI